MIDRLQIGDREADVTRILLKARPTREQLLDRLSAPRPDGLELYLDRLDLTPATWLGDVTELVSRCPGTDRLTWIVEAPIRTLGGQYFDLSNSDADHRETVERVIRVGEAIGAVAANVHVVAPTLDPSTLSPAERLRKLEACGPLLRFYLERSNSAGLIPQVENIPPVGRMRESAFVFSAIGAAPADLLELAARFPALRFTVDTSHAGLYLNWLHGEPGLPIEGFEPHFVPVRAFLRQGEAVADLPDLCRRLAPRTLTVHVSNARGWLGEGTRYDDGDFDLDAALGQLIGRAAFLVTETLEADSNHAVGMREVQARLAGLVAKRRLTQSRSMTKPAIPRPEQ